MGIDKGNKLAHSHALAFANTTKVKCNENLAFVLKKVGKFDFEKRAKPALQTPRDVLVRVIATRLCGSDVDTRNNTGDVSLT